MLCETIKVSPRHFRRLFTEAFGVCPKSWLKSERMVYARNLLRGGLPLKDVSERLGFICTKDFCREFRRCYGLSPSTFRSSETMRVMQHLDRAS